MTMLSLVIFGATLSGSAFSEALGTQSGATSARPPPAMSDDANKPRPLFTALGLKTSEVQSSKLEVLESNVRVSQQIGLVFRGL